MKIKGFVLAATVGAVAVSATAWTVGSSGHHVAPTAVTQAAPNGELVADSAKVHRGLLREFTTQGGQGYFYTAYAPEAKSVVTKFHFRPTGRTFGYVDAARVKGTVPLFRLHVVGRQAYLVTADVRERNRLLASHRFTQDGVLGYITTRSAKGMVPIWRVGGKAPGYWRLATTAQERQLVRQGWHLDGLVGFFWAKA